MSTLHRFITMVRTWPIRSGVYILAPLLALVLQFVMSMYHGTSLLLTAGFGVVVLVGTVATTRYHLAAFRLSRMDCEASLDEL